jgi:hypothetical protein
MHGTDYIKIRWKADVLASLDLPDIEYPIPMQSIEQAVISVGIHFADMLSWIQDYCANSSEDWLDYEPAMLRLSELITPEEAPKEIISEGEHWCLLIASVDLAKEIVTIQRGEFLVAALQDYGDGRLVASAYRPLDSKSTEYLRGLSSKPAPDGTVCMRPNNWEYALDCSAGLGNMYAAERGEAYLSYWQFGLGISYDGTKVDKWYLQMDLAPILSKYTAMQIILSYEKSEE